MNPVTTLKVSAGPHIFTADGQAEELFRRLTLFLQGQAPCQTMPSDEGADELEDAEELLNDELSMNVVRRSFVGSRFYSRCDGGAHVLLIAARECLHNTSWVATNVKQLLTVNHSLLFTDAGAGGGCV
jgi:hypothetical protein